MKFLLTIAALAATCVGVAQQRPTVSAHITPDSMMIGDRFEYVIEVEKDQVQTIVFPEFRDKGQGIEVVKSHPIDTLERKGRLIKLRKRYELTSFEEGNFNLGRAAVLYADKNITDTLYSPDSLRIRVATFEIDTTKQTIHDIKAQKNLLFRMEEVSGYLMWGFLAIALLLLVVFGLKRLLDRRGRTLGSLFKPAPPVPPHVAAIRALEALHNQKLWQNNRHKHYYSGISDILRIYIEARYGIAAMEMTSDQIIGAMRNVEGLTRKSTDDLTSILRTADLVKFAKAVPDADDNEADYLKAYYFVEETKQAEEHAGEPEPMKN